MYVDDVLIFSKKKVWIDIFIKSLFEGIENFELTDESDINKYLSIDIQKYKDSTYELRQLFLIKHVLDKLNLLPTET